MNFRDSAISTTRRCLDCKRPITPDRRKCAQCRKAPKPTIVVLRSSLARPRSLSVSKPYKRRTKRAKGQNPDVRGSMPYLRSST